MIWTRVTSPAGATKVRWRVGYRRETEHVVASATVGDVGARDYTVKVDVPGLSPGRTYYYAFDADGDSRRWAARRRSRRSVERVRLGDGVLLELPRGLLQRLPLPREPARPRRGAPPGRLHLRVRQRRLRRRRGSGRVPLPAGEATTLADYRWRYATYRSDVDLQAAHAAHPFIAVWDDHEIVERRVARRRADAQGQRGRMARPAGRRLSGLSRMDAGARGHRRRHPVVPRTSGSAAWWTW